VKYRRVFVAAPVDHVTRAECAAVAKRVRAAGFPGRWVPPENYHVTVAFIGPIGEPRVPEIARVVRDAARTAQPFDLVFDTVGAFLSRAKPRVVWLGPEHGSHGFAELCDAVRTPLAALNIRFKPEADPHVTLARSDGRTPLPDVDPPHRPPVLRVDTLILYESIHGGDDGVRYEPLERFPLGL
jgi:RNA 2',3'-cyclic 3'-phosphodiesterase